MMIADLRATTGQRWDDFTTEDKAQHRAWWVAFRRYEIANAKRGYRVG